MIYFFMKYFRLWFNFLIWGLGDCSEKNGLLWIFEFMYWVDVLEEFCGFGEWSVVCKR